MEMRQFGQSDLRVSALGFGAGTIGDERIEDQEVGRLLNQVLDSGINLIDTARGYGVSEERIGRHLSHRRQDYVLSTKIGYGIEGYPDWTYDCILAGVEAALKRLQTDYLDIVHLHSCPIGTLEHGEVIEALAKAQEQGKVRVAAYSGENEALAYAAQSRRFGSLMASANICEQHILDTLQNESFSGLGFIAKRPLANAPWRFAERPVGDYCEVYWERWQAMGLNFPEQELSTSLRFSVFSPGVDSCIVGTTKLEHLQANLRAVELGPLPEDSYQHYRTLFRTHDQGWKGQI